MPETLRYLIKMLVSEPNHAGAMVVRFDPLPTFVDPDNWEWRAQFRAKWTPAEEYLQNFRAKWYGVTESQSASAELSLKPLRNLDQSIILVRESYVAMFDTVWAKAISSLGRRGVIITGQPGIGAYLLSHIHYVESCLKARHCSFTISLFGFYSGNKSSSSPWTAKGCTSSTIIKSIQRRVLLVAYHSLIPYPARKSSSGRYLISASRKSRGSSWSAIRVCQCRQLRSVPFDTRSGIKNGLLYTLVCRYGLATSSREGESY
jgi:hypothetical protein